MNVLFVCSGNTCRSPMAKVLLELLVKQRGLDIIADSAGLFAFDGAPASDGASQVMREDYGLTLADHHAKSLDDALAHWADRIVCMTGAHKGLVQAEFPAADACTLGEWATRDMDIRDPHGGRIVEYRACAKAIKQLLDDIVGGCEGICGAGNVE